MPTQPVLTIVAGANGSGKTTFARPYVASRGLQFLNADDLTKAFEERGENNAMMKGGRAFFALLNQALADKIDVVIETTLSGTYTTKVMLKAQRLGYLVKMIYIFLPNANMCVDRVKIRVTKNGHHVPEEDIRRRYYRSIENFRSNFRASLNVWYLYYNGGTSHELVALSADNAMEIADGSLYDFFNQINTDDTI